MSSKVLRSTYRQLFTAKKFPDNCFRRLSYSQKVNEKIKSDQGSSSSTVDNKEIQMFSQMKDWWDLNGTMKPLHSMNAIRVPFIRDGLLEDSNTQSAKTSTPLVGKNILDVGCGAGILSEGLARIGATVTGIDASEQLIAIAEEHKCLDPKIADNRPTYYHTTIEDHVTTHSNVYDGVVASEVIEHVNNKDLFVRSCIGTLKPGGKIFFTTPNRTTASRILCIFVAEYVLRLLPQGTHQYEKFITPTELTFMLERNGCHVEKVYGTFYELLTNRWSFISSQQLMYALQAVKC